MNSVPFDKFSPIFVVGNSRSGTTLISRILGNSSQVFSFEELHFFEQMWDPEAKPKEFTKEDAVTLAARLINIQRNCYLNLEDIDTYTQEAKSLVDGLSDDFSPPIVFAAFLMYETQRNGKAIPCEQTPRNVLYIDNILKIYPNARIINMVRDPRDVLLSQKRKWRRAFFSDVLPNIEALRSWINYHPFTISKLWGINIATSEKCKHDDRVHFLKFEDVLSQPEKSIKNLCSFVDIPFEEGFLDVPQIGSSSEIDRPNATGINKDRIGGWQQGGLSFTEIFICEKSNHHLMQKYGYDLDSCTPNVIKLVVSFMLFPLKLCLALLFNLNRMKNIKGAIMKRLA